MMKRLGEGECAEEVQIRSRGVPPLLQNTSAAAPMLHRNLEKEKKQEASYMNS